MEKMVLSDKDLKTRLIPNHEIAAAKQLWKESKWETIANQILIDPFKPQALGPCCYGLSVGEEFVSLRDPYNTKPLKEGEHITINPGETVLILTREYICLPRTILAMVVPRASWIFEGTSLSATRVDPTWYGKLLIGFTNMAKNPIALDYGDKFCTCYFMETTDTDKVLTCEAQRTLGREKIGSIKFAHARPQTLLMPDKVRKDDIDKVVDLYGWPWDVVRGIFDLTRKEIGNWVEKEVTAEIVMQATSAAEAKAFDKLVSQYEQQTKWTRNLSIAIITLCGTIAAAVIVGVIAYIIKSF